MGSVILGTAGHIDHGKTALVRALTGTDTDRLKEEKARGITIELGFAELSSKGLPHFGVVDVPGHEAFVRAMVAGAAGMDVVLLVVAADEGVMPQTREHLAIVELLAVPELVVAVTKSDLVDADWLELVDADIADVLAETPYSNAARIPTSATEGVGLNELLDALASAAGRVRSGEREDVTRLPLDRVFTIQGTGTVVTGTMWSGVLSTGERARILPADVEARVRSLQVHGGEVDSAEAGDRTAVALAGDGADRDLVARGATLVTEPSWEPTWMLTTRVRLLADTDWTLEHNQRVHVHLGTAEVLARCALLADGPIGAGEAGWVQLRLEEPLVARTRDRFVLRAYSPVTTIGGGRVAEVAPAKRRSLGPRVPERLELVMDGAPEEALVAFFELAGWSGAERAALPVLVGLSPSQVADALRTVAGAGCLLTDRHAFGPTVTTEAKERLLAAVEQGHAADSLRTSIPLSGIRTVLPKWAPRGLAEAAIARLVDGGRLEAVDGGVRIPGHRSELSADQVAASAELERVLSEAGLAAPTIDELPPNLKQRPDLWSLIRRLEALGVVSQVADGLYVTNAELDEASERIRSTLRGREDLGPADFRAALPVTRKHLIPLLNFFDGRGTTIRSDGGRSVP